MLDDLLAIGRAAVLPAAGSVVATVGDAFAGVWCLGRPARVPGQEPPIGYYSDEREQPGGDWASVYGPVTRWD